MIPGKVFTNDTHRLSVTHTDDGWRLSLSLVGGQNIGIWPGDIPHVGNMPDQVIGSLDYWLCERDANKFMDELRIWIIADRPIVRKVFNSRQRSVIVEYNSTTNVCRVLQSGPGDSLRNIWPNEKRWLSSPLSTAAFDSLREFLDRIDMHDAYTDIKSWMHTQERKVSQVEATPPSDYPFSRLAVLEKAFLWITLVTHALSALLQSVAPQLLASAGYWEFAPGWQHEIGSWNIGIVILCLFALRRPAYVKPFTAIAVVSALWFMFSMNHLTKPIQTWHPWLAAMEGIGVVVGVALIFWRTSIEDHS